MDPRGVRVPARLAKAKKPYCDSRVQRIEEVLPSTRVSMEHSRTTSDEPIGQHGSLGQAPPQAANKHMGGKGPTVCRCPDLPEPLCNTGQRPLP